MNWTAARAGAPGTGEDEAGAHDEAAVGDAPAGRAESDAADGVTDVPDPPPAAALAGVDLAGVDLAGVDLAGVDELADVVAQPAARLATARATMVEYAVLRVINSVSLITFTRTLSRLARL